MRGTSISRHAPNRISLLRVTDSRTIEPRFVNTAESGAATFGKLGLSQIGYELFQVMQDFGILARQLNSL
jgi:hypothetical protein